MTDEPIQMSISFQEWLDLKLALATAEAERDEAKAALVARWRSSLIPPPPSTDRPVGFGAADLMERLLARPTDDHERGCEGRNCACTCGFLAEGDALCLEAAGEIARLRAFADGIGQAVVAFLTDVNRDDSEQ